MAGGGVMMGVLFFSGCSLSLWEDEKLLEVDSCDGCTKM